MNSKHSNELELLTAKSFQQSFLSGTSLVESTLSLTLGNCHIQCHSNNQALLAQLAEYFKPFKALPSTPDIEITLIEAPQLETPYEFIDWAREPGKTGRKDSYYPLADGRLLRKVRTGMLFLQSESNPVAIGPCIKNDNQVINFINAQYMNWLQQRDWLICHSAAAVLNQQGIAICGFSGGGKSTLMLHLLSATDAKFVSNDRLFLKADSASVNAEGVAKLPRINPGTALNNPDLEAILEPEKAAQLNALPIDELWDLEDKYDVDIDAIYGANRIQLQTPLTTMLILNWDRQSTQPTTVAPVDIRHRSDLLPAVMKSPGPFYQNKQGEFLNGSQTPAPERYIELLSKVNVLEASGSIDFDLATQHIISLLQPSSLS